ncbi:putative zinc transporter msc2 [Neophaeococcomyces mojaviensis]|uniref:Zinc transporter msc2 n=1 Tax=Neophaeococcomyces mojaviensis TaxID=3383035 RepID=A0ACC3ADG8_9EURO|nr:putative zinc transporter msc2 [Knufia sp. JES_112]
MSHTYTLPVSVADQFNHSHEHRKSRSHQRQSHSRLAPPFALPRIPSGTAVPAEQLTSQHDHILADHNHHSSETNDFSRMQSHDSTGAHPSGKRSFEAKNTPAAMSHRHQHQHQHKHVSKPTDVLLHATENYSLLHGILADRESRRIFYFMLLNLAFMGVQSTYGFLTGSLGLISDSIHMFFDCVALLVGVCAAVMSKWPPSARFPYGYGKIDTLAGLGNGIFLMLISVEIVYEAIERLFAGSDIHRTTELLLVSLAGLAVNLVGIFAFHGHHGHHHGHDHSHGGDGHGHGSSHEAEHDRRRSNAASASPTKPQASGGHGHHHHGGENMQGIYLHIMADALGSVAVVLSTLLVQLTGWSGFDPLASCIIAILIFASTVPLVTSTTKILLLSLNSDIEYNLRDILGGITSIRGVVGYTVPKFWLEDIKKDDDHHHHHHDHEHTHSHDHDHSHTHAHPHDHHHHDHHDCHSHSPSSDHAHDQADISTSDPTIIGTIHVQISQSASLPEVQRLISAYFTARKMDVVVQYEREGDNKCWCSATGNGYTKTPQTGGMQTPLSGSFSGVLGFMGGEQQQERKVRKKGSGGLGVGVASPLGKML